VKTPGYRYILIPFASGSAIAVGYIVIRATRRPDLGSDDPTIEALLPILFAPSRWCHELTQWYGTWFYEEVFQWPLIGLLVGLVLYTWRKFFPVR
jgi:hypothetical protein